MAALPDTIQSARLEFDGTQDYIDVEWPADFDARTFALGVGVADGSVEIDADVTVDDPGSSRIEPSARFVGVVNVIRSKVLP